jgi:predicted transcriptional regulator
MPRRPGRPRRPGARPWIVFSVRERPHTLRALDDLAWRQRLSRVALIRRVLAEYLARAADSIGDG